MSTLYVPKLELSVKPYIGCPYLTSKSQLLRTDILSFDCWTFVHYLFTHNFTVSLNANIFISADSFIEIWHKDDTHTYLRDVREWDMALFALQNTFVDHCALIIFPSKIVHCTPAHGVCIEPLEKYEHHLFQIARLQHLA